MTNIKFGKGVHRDTGTFRSFFNRWKINLLTKAILQDYRSYN